jgi:hypothetical protein
MIETGWRKAFFVCGGGICAVRALPRGSGAKLEVGAGLALCRSARSRLDDPLTPEEAEVLLLIGGFVRRPPPELVVLPLDADRIAARVAGRQLPRRAA